MAISLTSLLGRRLAYTAGPVACLLLTVLVGGSHGRTAIEGGPLALALGALHRQTGDQVVWIDTGSQQDPASIAIGLGALGRAHVRGVVVDVPPPVGAGSAEAALEAKLATLPSIFIVPPGAHSVDAVVAHLPPAPFTPPPLSGVGEVSAGIAAAATALAVEPLGSPDADGVWRESALMGGPASAPYPGAALVALSIARGQNPRALNYFDATRLLVGGKPMPVGRGGAVVPFYGPAAGEPNGLRRVTLSELTEPEFDAATLEGRLVVMGHGPDLTTPLGVRSRTEVLAERIEALDSNAYAVRGDWSGVTRVLLTLAALLVASITVAPITRRYGLGAALAVAVAGTLVILLGEVVLLIQASRYLPLAWPAGIWFAASLGAGLGERRRLQNRERDAAEAATIITHDPPPPTPARRAADLRPIPVGAAGPARSSPADNPYQRTGNFQRTAGFLRTGSFPARSLATPGSRPQAAPIPAAESSAPDYASPRSLEELDQALRALDSAPHATDIASRLLGGAPAQAPSPAIAHYEIEREIGRGALSTVYLARDTRDGRSVALKAINLADDGDAGAELKARFFREAETATRLNHPGIVRVTDFGQQGRLGYLAMEYANGRLLSSYTNSANLLPACDVLEIVAKMADALEHAHNVGVVHRDIKPANAIVNPQSLATKVTDFGIAKLADQSQTRAGVVLGTPSFMAPEQLEGGTVTGRSDLFALGVTLFQLLTGQLPFMADSMPGLMEKIATAPHPPLSAIRPDLPAGVGEIIDRALEKDPERRYASAGEMARALRACAVKLLI